MNILLTSTYNTSFSSSSPHYIKSTNQNTFSKNDKEEKTNEGFVYSIEIKPQESNVLPKNLPKAKEDSKK